MLSNLWCLNSMKYAAASLICSQEVDFSIRRDNKLNSAASASAEGFFIPIEYAYNMLRCIDLSERYEKRNILLSLAAGGSLTAIISQTYSPYYIILKLKK